MILIPNYNILNKTRFIIETSFICFFSTIFSILSLSFFESSVYLAPAIGSVIGGVIGLIIARNVSFKNDQLIKNNIMPLEDFLKKERSYIILTTLLVFILYAILNSLFHDMFMAPINYRVIYIQNHITNQEMHFQEIIFPFISRIFLLVSIILLVNLLFFKGVLNHSRRVELYYNQITEGKSWIISGIFSLALLIVFIPVMWSVCYYTYCLLFTIFKLTSESINSISISLLSVLSFFIGMLLTLSFLSWFSYALGLLSPKILREVIRRN